MTREISKVLKTLEKAEGLTMLAELGQKHTPFQMLISTILSARARDEVTLPLSKKLFKEYGTANKLADADSSRVKEIIRPIGFYNVKTKNIIATAKMIRDEFKGRVPDKMSELIKLPGVGRKVGNCVLVYAFEQDAIPVDTHVHRLSNRLGWVKTKNPEETERELERIVPKKYWNLVNEVFVMHGKNICTPISPFCSKCPVFESCKRVGVKKNR
jgi:endonuclease-3